MFTTLHGTQLTYFSGLAAYNPATQFAAGGLGAWYDPSDYATLFQDSAGATPVTAAAQPVGRMLDKSGRSNTLLQATAASRSITATTGAIQYLTFDGVDDSMATGAVTLSADMDCFIAVRRNSNGAGILVGASIGKLFGYFDSAGTGLSAQGCGTNVTNFVNGVQVAGGTATTGAQVGAALSTAVWNVLEVRNLDLSTFTAINISQIASYFVNGDIGGMILAPAGDAATRTNNRQYLGNKVGLTL